MRQMPELYLRGSIFNKTMKNLTNDQLLKLENKVEELLELPPLFKSREKFCQILSNTIGADYRESKEASLQEYTIALMKAALYIMFHKPNEEIFDDPIQTRKLVSQITYNYVRQILNENKIPKSQTEKEIFDDPYVIAFEQVCSILYDNKIEFDYEHLFNEFWIIGDIFQIDLKCSKKFKNLTSKYKKIGVDIKIDSDRINIIKTKSYPFIKAKIKKMEHIGVMNLDHDSDEDGNLVRDNIEYHISKKSCKNESNFDPDRMRSILPDNLVDLYDTIINSDDFNKNKVSKMLKISVNDINRKLDKIKLYYYASS